jgi:hypothetical protein
MKNTGKIVRSKVNQNYTIVKNNILKNESMSLKAKGLLCLLLSLPPDWIIYKTQLSQFSSDGRDATTGAFNELVEMGYITSMKLVNEKGQKMGYDYIVYDEIPPDDSVKPITENPFTDKPKTDITALLNTNILNKKIQNKKINNNNNNIRTRTSIENYENIIFSNEYVEGLDIELKRWNIL